MPRRGTARPIAAVLAGAALLTTPKAAWSGHELAVYPSYYPHEIRIETIAPTEAAALLQNAKIQAYIGDGVRFPGGPPKAIRTVESLGAIVTLRLNPASPLAATDASACATAAAIMRELAGNHAGLVLHPYPVTPFDGDYLYHVDRAAAARGRFLDGLASPPPRGLTIRADDRLAGLVRPEWRATGQDWDAKIEATDVAAIVADATVALDGWSGPAWLKTGWFRAERLFAGTNVDAAVDERAEAMVRRLQNSDYRDPVERINLERDLVAALTQGCHDTVVGYMVKREYVNADFNDGIENIGYDSLTGLASAMFIRTVKLKNFPWNGWLALGIAARPQTPWNPIAGFADGFGRLLWSAVGDAGLVPAPYDAGWMLNRVSDVRAGAGR